MCAGILEAMAQIDLARHAAKGMSKTGRLLVGFSYRRATINEVDGS
jgi:hypothetical protein